jgi:hypothetical protein
MGQKRLWRAFDWHTVPQIADDFVHRQSRKGWAHVRTSRTSIAAIDQRHALLRMGPHFADGVDMAYPELQQK